LSEERVDSEGADRLVADDKNEQAHISAELSATGRMKALARRYVEERNWVMVDCLIVWLHNGSGATARSKFSGLVIEGMMQDFSRNLKFNYALEEIQKATNKFENDLKQIGIDLLYGDYYATKRDVMPQIIDAMAKRTLEGMLSDEDRRLVFIFAKFYEAIWNPAYGILPSDLETFVKSLKVVYRGIFVDDLRLEHPEDDLRRLGLVLEVDWVRSKHPESSTELVVPEWAKDFLTQVDKVVKISTPKEVDRVEDFILLLNQRELIPQLVFYDLMLEKNAYGRMSFFKNEVDIVKQMELLMPGSFFSFPSRSGICERINGHIMLSPLAKDKIAKALDRVKRQRMASTLGKIVEVLDFLESEGKLAFNIRLILDFPRVWKIEGLKSSLYVVVMPWCKTSDAQFIKDLSQNGAIVVFTKDQELSALKTLLGQDPNVSFCFINKDLVTYTSHNNELLQFILDQFAKSGNEVRLVESTEDVRKLPQIERRPEGAISELRLREIIAKGENEKVEFKKVDILSDSYHLAKSIVAIANSGGGLLLIGVSDDGQVQKIRVEKKQIEKIINVSRDKVDPPIKPVVYSTSLNDGNVCVVEIPGMSKGIPHYVRSRDGNVCFIRVGPTVREPSHEERRRLYER
jgi:hypothetical protein